MEKDLNTSQPAVTGPLIVKPAAIRKEGAEGARAGIPAPKADANVAAFQCAGQVVKALSQLRQSLCLRGLRLLSYGAVVVAAGACVGGVGVLAQDRDAMRLVDTVLGATPGYAN
jgi:hypothetical protein